MMQTFDRRRLLALGGGMAALGGFSASRVGADPRFGADPFSLGVASGDPTPDGFVIWTRLAPDPLDAHGGMPMRTVMVNWEVAEDDGFSRVVSQGEAPAFPDLAHAVHVEVAGLRPHRHYWYRFFINRSERSPIGMVRTAPAVGATPERLRIGLAGCQNYEAGFFSAYAHLSREPDLDAVYHYGDYIYVGAGGRGAKMNGTEERVLVRAIEGRKVMSLDDFRRRYAQYKMDPDLQAAHAAAAFITTYDDGEVANDFVGDFDAAGTPPEVFALRRLAAMQAWYEHTPVRRAQFPRLTGMTVFRRLDYGGLLRMHVLDTRAYRTDASCAPGETGACGRQDDLPPTVLGEAQEAWLREGLGGGSRWNLLAQQVLIMPFNTGGARMGGTPGGWNPHPAARDRLVRSIAEQKLTNVVVASGGAHQHYVGVIPMDDQALDGPAAATEFHGTSISSGGDGEPIRRGARELLSATPNLDFINAQRGYQLFEVTEREWRTDVKVVDRVQTRGGAVSTAARFVVSPARAGAERG